MKTRVMFTPKTDNEKVLANLTKKYVPTLLCLMDMDNVDVDVYRIDPKDDSTAYTYITSDKKASVFINPAHRVLSYDKGDMKGKQRAYRALFGKIIHELLHKLYTDPQAEKAMVDKKRILHKNLFHNVVNIVEDFTIESRAIARLEVPEATVERLKIEGSDFIAFDPAKCLATSILLNWQHSAPVNDTDSVMNQIYAALIQFTDMGPLRAGSTLSKEAETALAQIYPLILEAIWLDPVERAKKAFDIYTIIEKYLEDDSEDIDPGKGTEGTNGSARNSFTPEDIEKMTKAGVGGIQKQIVKMLRKKLESEKDGDADSSPEDGKPEPTKGASKGDPDDDKSEKGKKDASDDGSASEGKPSDGKPDSGKPKSTRKDPEGEPKDVEPEDSKADTPYDGSKADAESSDDDPDSGEPEDADDTPGDDPMDGESGDSEADIPDDGSEADAEPSDGDPEGGEAEDADDASGDDPIDGESGDSEADIPDDGSESDAESSDGDPDSGESEDADDAPDDDPIDGESGDSEADIPDDGSEADAEPSDGDPEGGEAEDADVASGDDPTDDGNGEDDESEDVPYESDPDFIEAQRMLLTDSDLETVDLSDMEDYKPEEGKDHEKDHVSTKAEKITYDEYKGLVNTEGEIKLIRRKIVGCSDETISQYRRVCDANRTFISAFARRMKVLITEDETIEVDKKGLLDADRYATRHQTTLRFFNKTYVKNRKDCRVQIMLDVSGSMCGDRITRAKNALACIVEAMYKAKIPVSVIAFHDDYGTKATVLEHYVNYKTSEADRAGIMTIKAEGDNFDSFAIRAGVRELKKIRATNTLMIIISDGQPCSFLCPNDMKETKKAVQEAKRQTKVIGIGIAADLKVLKGFYQDTFVELTDMQTFMPGLARIIEKEVRKWK